MGEAKRRKDLMFKERELPDGRKLAWVKWVDNITEEGDICVFCKHGFFNTDHTECSIPKYQISLRDEIRWRVSKSWDESMSEIICDCPDFKHEDRHNAILYCYQALTGDISEKLNYNACDFWLQKLGFTKEECLEYGKESEKKRAEELEREFEFYERGEGSIDTDCDTLPGNYTPSYD